MPDQTQAEQFRFEISLSVLNHLGRNLYRNFTTVLGEAISNSWDADAKNVWINIDRDNSTFSIKDDGNGMDASDFQEKFLKIGYSKRKDGTRETGSGRPYIGAKGIGKLALLSCAKRISVFSKRDGENYVGGVIDNQGLDEAIKEDRSSEEYPLETLNYDLIKDLQIEHEKGTIIVFEDTNEQIRNSDAYLKKLLALSFKFSIIDDNFTIHVNGVPISVEELKPLADATQFMWVVNQYSDTFEQSITTLDHDRVEITCPMNIKGFVGSVRKPSQLKITGTDERATIDLFVNGRLREKNIIRHIPKQRIVEGYIYGQIHFDDMDNGDGDPFTSSREGVIETDQKFQALLSYLKEDLLNMIIDQWDEFRLALRDEGDDENPRKSKRQRKAEALVNEAANEYRPDKEDTGFDHVDSWLKSLKPDADYNVDAYVDCFLSENLIRKFVEHKSIPLKDGVQKFADQYKSREAKTKGDANISFEIRKTTTDLSYLDMDALAVTVEGTKQTAGQTLWSDAISFKPVRNAVGHTGLLNPVAKTHLNTTFENIKARIKTLLSNA